MADPIARRRIPRLAQLEKAAAHFELGRLYTEQDVNEILSAIFQDHVFARRLLIEWNYLERRTDGSAYWLRAVDGT